MAANRAAGSCPSGKAPMELPAGYLLSRAMVFRTDCCPGLALEYRRGDSRVAVLQIAGHRPLTTAGPARTVSGTFHCRIDRVC
ncbi:MAG: hypothetical protein R6W82_04280 [bacterium]